MTKRGLPLNDRFMAHVAPEPNCGCWLWTANATHDGYGLFRLSANKTVQAHRFSYEQHRGPIPHGLVIDHLCRVRSCVNPDHMEVVSNRTNILRGVAAPAVNSAKTHCIHGHPLSGDNLRIFKCRHGTQRSCVACNRASVAKRAQRISAMHPQKRNSQ